MKPVLKNFTVKYKFPNDILTCEIKVHALNETQAKELALSEITGAYGSQLAKSVIIF